MDWNSDNVNADNVKIFGEKIRELADKSSSNAILNINLPEALPLDPPVVPPPSPPPVEPTLPKDPAPSLPSSKPSSSHDSSNSNKTADDTASLKRLTISKEAFFKERQRRLGQRLT